MADREPLSVAIITLNAATDLGRCLDSVAWADDRLVVDAGSTDGTREIAEGRGARVVLRDWPGFVAQKNHAVAQARHEWVLSLDADEWLTERGAHEMRRAIDARAAQAYAVDRRTVFLGAYLRHAWRPDRQVRLFRRDAGRFAGGHVHEAFRPNPGVRVERLAEPLHHEPYRTLAAYVERMNRYTDLAAQSLHEDGARASRARMLLGPPAAFLKQYLQKRGCLDGTRGLVVSAGSAFYVLLKYAKLWELNRAARRREAP